MKNFCLSFIFCFALSAQAFAQAPAMQWQKSFGGTVTDEGFAITQTADGGYISAAYSNSSNGDVTGSHGLGDYWVIKLDGSGNVQWKKCLGGTAMDYGQYIRQTADGGYVMTGFTSSGDGDITSFQGGEDFWIVKLDTGGAIQWQKTYGGTGQDVSYSIKQTTDKGYVVAGAENSHDGDVTGNQGTYDMWIIKIDSMGSLQWQKALGGSLTDFAYDVIQTFDGGYIATGYTESNNGDITNNQGLSDVWVVKLDTGGNMQWQKTFGGSGYDWSYAVLQAADSGYIVAGAAYSADGDVAASHGGGDYWVLKLDTAGNILWQKTYGSTGVDECYGAAKTSDGGFIFAGYTNTADGDVTVNKGLRDYWLVKTDAVGNLLWQQTFGGTKNDMSRHAEETADGGFIITGSSYSNDGDATSNQGGEDVWLIKLQGPATSVSVRHNIEQFVVYPNPAVNIVTVKCAGHFMTTYKITDLWGIVMSEGQLANATEAINIGGLAPGLYVLEIFGDSKQSFKIIKQ